MKSPTRLCCVASAIVALAAACAAPPAAAYEPAPLRGAALRDSINQARRVTVVLDSIEAEGKIPAPALAMLRRALTQGATGRNGVGHHIHHPAGQKTQKNCA